MGGGAAIILWLLLPIIIAVVAVMVSRSRDRKRTEQAGPGPPAPSKYGFPPPPQSSVAEHPVIRPQTVIATFNSLTGWAGKEITFSGGQFILQGYGPITAPQVLNYDRQGQLTWAYEGLREWVVSLAVSTVAVASVLTGRGVGIRFAAWLVDGFVFVVVGAPLLYLAGFRVGSSVEGGQGLYYLWLAGLFVYYWWFEAACGWTPGKLATGLRVVMEDGSKLTVGAAFLRTLLRLVDFLPSSYLIGAIAVWSTKRNQRIGDLAARALVVGRKDVLPEPILILPSPVATSATSPAATIEEASIVVTTSSMGAAAVLGSESEAQPVQPVLAQAVPRRGVAGFALSLVGFIMPVVWPVGLVLSWRDIRREKRERQPHGLSLAGLVVSAVGTTAVAVLVVAFLAGAPIPVLSNLRDTPGNSAVKEGIRTIQGGIEAWAADHGDKYPPASEVSRIGLVADYVDEWPDNPYTHLPMTRGRRPGDFQYSKGSRYTSWDDWFNSVTTPSPGEPARKEPKKIPSYSLTGYGRDGKAIVTVP